MNTTPPPVEDQELMARLGRTLAEVDPPPSDLLDLGRATYGLRRLDEELAELVGDSSELASATRGEDTEERLLSFSAEDMSIDLQVVRDPDGVVELLGEVDPPSTGSVVIDQVGAEGTDVPLVEGRFTVRLGGAGPVRVRIVPEGGPAVSVSWFSV